MKFMMIVKASRDSEAVVLLDDQWLQASSLGARVKFAGGERSVIQGPFAEVN